MLGRVRREFPRPELRRIQSPVGADNKEWPDRSRLHQRIHQVPHLVWHNLNHGTPSPHQQPALLDFDRQTAS